MTYTPRVTCPKSDLVCSLIRLLTADVSFVLVKGRQKADFLKRKITKPVFNLEIFGCEKFKKSISTYQYFEKSYCSEPLHQPQIKTSNTNTTKGLLIQKNTSSIILSHCAVRKLHYFADFLKNWTRNVKIIEHFFETYARGECV